MSSRGEEVSSPNAKNRRSWSAWARGGSIAMAALAVISLGATVVASQRALSDASDVIIRGEGDLLIASLMTELADEPSPTSTPAMERALAAHQANGLRYVAVLDREGNVIAEAGHAEIPKTPMQRPGASKIVGRRARVTGPMARERRGFGAGPGSGPGAGGPHPPPGGLLVAELEPPVIEMLRTDLTRIGVVATVAGIVLLAFSIAWSRSARRLALLEDQRVREQRLVALGSMSSVMAHELRNPLASLKGHAQLLVEDLETDPSDKKKHTKAARIVAEAERLELLTTTLLDFVRDGPIQEEAITPRALIERAMEDLPAATARVDITFSDDAPKELRVDVGRLARALHNLIDNALQATDANSDHDKNDHDKNERVTIHVAANATITVRDHGPGLPSGAIERIFEPFMTTRVRGTGLGLAVARRIVEQHGGTLDGENHPEGGALFTIRLLTTQ